MALRTLKAEQKQNTTKTPAPATCASTKSTNDHKFVNTIRHVFSEELQIHKKKIKDIIRSDMKIIK